MHTACLPTVRVMMATTRCQYQGVYIPAPPPVYPLVCPHGKNLGPGIPTLPSPPETDRQTPMKTLPSRNGGNDSLNSCKMNYFVFLSKSVKIQIINTSQIIILIVSFCGIYFKYDFCVNQADFYIGKGMMGRLLMRIQ